MIRQNARPFFGPLAVILSACILSFITNSRSIAMPVGFASLNGGTTGGGNGPTVTATTASQFRNFAQQSGPLTIMVDGSLDIGGTDIASNKTILGVGSTSALIGSLEIKNVSNVIVQNLTISNPNDTGEGDSITVSGSTNVWIDHNDVIDAPDGLLDIVREADFVTVSWNKFYYTDNYAQNVNTGHRFASLIGNSDSRVEDADNLRVTMHHNHWGEHVRERMPRARYGDIHVFNSYFDAPGSNYAIRAAIGAEVLIENNHFENVDDPYEKFNPSSGPLPLVEASGNLFVNTTGDTDAGDDVFDPAYEYTLVAASNVKSMVLAGAGVGNLDVSLPGDFNGDGFVTAEDFLAWQRGESPDPLSSADLTEWQNIYAPDPPSNPPLSGIMVPEPSTLLLALVMAVPAVWYRR